jgi:hypothetical protein
MTAQILNVVIVLIAIYVALGVACSFLQEQHAALRELRPKALAKGLEQLVARDPVMLEKILRAANESSDFTTKSRRAHDAGEPRSASA